MKKRLMVIAAVVIIAAVVYFVKGLQSGGVTERDDGRYQVNCDTKRFQPTLTDYRFKPDSNVFLLFPANEAYSFQVDGADSFSADYYPSAGYLIRFVMPENTVDVTYEKNGEIQAEQKAESINIALDENPTTGITWEYEISDEETAVLQESWYVIDPEDPAEPVDGMGGTHYFKFAVTGTGIVEIRFYETDGESRSADTLVYQYMCDDEGVELLEKYTLESK